MRKILFAAGFLLASMFIVTSCGGGKQSAAEEALQAQKDSLERVNAQQQDVLNQMNDAMAEIAFVLDTIASHEKIIVTGVDEDGKRLSRQGIRNRLDILATVIREQKEKLGLLEEKFANSALQIEQMHSIITFLENSLAQKNAEVERLQAQVNSQNFNLAVLEETVTLMTDTIAEERATNLAQKTQIEQQDVQLNEVYYVIGTENELTNKGLLKKEGKLFKKTKIDFSTINKSVLRKGDIRTLNEINVMGKKPKILSDVPKDSYSLDKLSDTSYILRILNPTQFWSANNRILIIQVKD